MTTPSGGKPSAPSAAASNREEYLRPSKGAGQGDGTTRRNLLAIVGGGLAGGLLAHHWVKEFGPVSMNLVSGTAPHRVVARTTLPPAMEEPPLPRAVHISLAHARDGDRSAARLVGPGFGKTASAPSPVPVARSPILPAKPRPIEAAWLRNAQPLIETGPVPAVAIVIDDLGLSEKYTRQAIALDKAVTLAIMTYAPHPEAWLERGRAARHEILVHVPMQPLNPRIDPGPRVLTVSLTDAEIRDRLRWGLGRMDGYVGINNHMGSRFTQDRAGMSVVLREVKSRGLLFLDSVTIGRTVGPTLARDMHMTFAERNVFLDDEPTVAGVSHQIAVLEKYALRHGSAIAIGHPHPATLSVLADWLPSARARGVAVVPLTSVVRRLSSRV